MTDIDKQRIKRYRVAFMDYKNTDEECLKIINEMKREKRKANRFIERHIHYFDKKGW